MTQSARRIEKQAGKRVGLAGKRRSPNPKRVSTSETQGDSASGDTSYYSDEEDDKVELNEVLDAELAKLMSTSGAVAPGEEGSNADREVAASAALGTQDIPETDVDPNTPADAQRAIPPMPQITPAEVPEDDSMGVEEPAATVPKQRQSTHKNENANIEKNWPLGSATWKEPVAGSMPSLGKDSFTPAVTRWSSQATDHRRSRGNTPASRPKQSNHGSEIAR